MKLLLRVVTVAALSKQPTDKHPPTMAGDKVFDSRLDPYVFEESEAELPAITVYTDDDTSTLMNMGDGSLPFKRHIRLRIEATLGSCETIETAEGLARAYMLPGTDAELEAKLNLFEQQIKWALFFRLDRSATSLWCKLVIRVHSIQSFISRDESSNNRHASVVLLLDCETPDDCPPNMALGAQPTPVKIDLSSFPAEYLREPLAVIYESNPSVRPVIDVLAGNTNTTVVFPVLERIGVTVDAIDPEADPNRFKPGQTEGPDGRAEVNATWEIKQ